jgi:hypothetical protein
VGAKRGGEEGKEDIMTLSLYTHMNKGNKKRRK